MYLIKKTVNTKIDTKLSIDEKINNFVEMS